jgi:5-methylcytosine-specific restriction endonuclease McrA
MFSKTNAVSASSDCSSPAVLSDAELLLATRRLVGRSNQLLAALLAHLAEVETRGIHRTRACSSLYTYCIYELRLSEDEAYRRVTAARLVRRFPALLDAIGAGELHLTGLLMLGPHLTCENLVEVLARAKHRTKKEIAGLVRLLDPLPDVPPRIEPLGPAPARLIPQAPTWSQFVGSMCPVRELAPGDRPRDWAESVNDTSKDASQVEPELPCAELASQEKPAPASPAQPTPQRFKVQFTASEGYVKLVEEARALLSHSAPSISLQELQLRAMRALVSELKRQKYAVTARPRKRSDGTSPALAPAAETEQTDATRSTDKPKHAPESEHSRQRGRRVPAAIRRNVFARDEARCTYADDSGRRCPETHGLELHHLMAFAQGGEHTEFNLTLRCRAHNALAAEEDFGRDFIERRRDSRAYHAPGDAEAAR